MTTKAATANGVTKEDAKYLPLIDEYLAEIKAMHENISLRRANGRKIMARIDRNLKGIQAIIQRVEATL
jgi:pyruvate-formate lyase-activating enzyme